MRSSAGEACAGSSSCSTPSAGGSSSSPRRASHGSTSALSRLPATITSSPAPSRVRPASAAPRSSRNGRAAAIALRSGPWRSSSTSPSSTTRSTSATASSSGARSSGRRRRSEPELLPRCRSETTRVRSFAYLLGEHEADVLADHVELGDVVHAARAEEVDKLADELLGCARAGGDTHHARARQPLLLHLAHGVRRVARAHNQHQVAAGSHLLDGRLAVGGGVTDVVGARADDVREALAQTLEDGARFVHGERRLGDVCDPLGILELELLDILLALDEHDLVGRLAHRPFHLLVPVVPDQHHRVALLGEADGLAVDLRDERAGGVDRVQAARSRARAHAGGDAMCGEHAHGVLRHFGLLLDEDRPAFAQLSDDVLVVHDLLAHVHRRSVDRERAFDGLHRAIDPCAVTARRREQQLLDAVGHGCHCRGRPGTLTLMSQRHLDRLTPVDASFLHQESAVSHMHIGGLTIVEGPPPSMEEFLEQIRRRLHLVPRYRHKLAYTAIDSGRPVWVDDPSFNLDYHVRHTALPAPGKWEQLQDLTARIFSQQLDRSKPLWEMWLIEGLEDDRFALITKTHHSLIDGIAGVDLATVLFDLSPDPPRTPITGRA